MTALVMHGDATDPALLAAVIDSGIDVVICDPPYSEHVHAHATSVGSSAAGPGVVPRDLGFAALGDDLRAALATAAAGAKRWTVLFSDHEQAHVLRAAVGGYVRTVVSTPDHGPDCGVNGDVIPWVRWSQPQLSGDRPCTGSEAVLHFHGPGKKRWNGPGSLVAYERRCMRGRDKHPTEKPIDLMLDLVSWFSDPGETVLDLCAGSGATIVAAVILGRNGIGIERDPEHARKADARVMAALSGTLTPRDVVRVQEWIESTITEASAVPEPRAADGSDVKTWERAQRRLADAARANQYLMKGSP